MPGIVTGEPAHPIALAATDTAHPSEPAGRRTRTGRRHLRGARDDGRGEETPPPAPPAVQVLAPLHQLLPALLVPTGTSSSRRPSGGLQAWPAEPSGSPATVATTITAARSSLSWLAASAAPPGQRATSGTPAHEAATAINSSRSATMCWPGLLTHTPRTCCSTWQVSGSAPLHQAGHRLPGTRADQRADQDVAWVVHARVHPGVRDSRRQEPQRQAEPGVSRPMAEAKANPDAACPDGNDVEVGIRTFRCSGTPAPTRSGRCRDQKDLASRFISAEVMPMASVPAAAERRPDRRPPPRARPRWPARGGSY